jgi:hypothetical protein
VEFLKYYLLYIPLFIVLTILILKYLNKQDDEKRLYFLKIVALVGIILHISKPLFYPYNGNILIEGTTNPDIFSFPSILRKITIENISAATTIFYLPILISKNKKLLDYIVIIGFLGGFLAIIYPAEVIFNTFDSLPIDQNNYKKGLFTFDTVRFYFVHYIPFIISFSLMYYKLHVFDSKRMMFFPVSLMILLSVLYLNELIIWKLGWLDDIENILISKGNIGAKGELFYDRNYRNFSFVFGIPDNFKEMGMFIDILVPKFMKEPNYIPVFWVTLPVFLYGPLLYQAFNKVSSKIYYKENNEIDYSTE